jgi:hypothetical protein
VRHGVPGALDAYNRMVGASNWAALRDAFNEHPVWAVQPARMVSVPMPVPATPATTTGMPAWMAGAAVNQWIEIPGTGGAGGSAVFAYSGFAYNDLTNEILIAAAGGHSDSSDNRVVSLRLNVDAPVWTQRMASSTITPYDVPYYPDGKPISRHLYSSLHYVPQVNRVMLFGVTGATGNAYSFDTVDGFNLDTNTWDPAGTWASTPFGERGSVVVRATGEVWTNNLSRWSPATRAWTKPITTRTNDQIRWPIAHDSRRNQLFTLNWADGMGYSNQAMYATVVPCNGSVQTSIAFKPSGAVDSFIADKPTYSAMDYDPDNDRFLFYCGQGAGAGRVYVVTPNAGTTWDMSLLPISGSKLPPPTPDSGVHNRFRYVPSLRGFVLMASTPSNLFFIRTA